MKEKFTRFHALVESLSAPHESDPPMALAQAADADEVQASAHEADVIDRESFAALEREYFEDPRGTLAQAQAAISGQLGHDELQSLMGTLRYILDQVDATPENQLDQERASAILQSAQDFHLASLGALHADLGQLHADLNQPAQDREQRLAAARTPGTLPPDWRFDGYTSEIRIDPADWQFETYADGHRWIWFCLNGILKAKANRIIAPFVRHEHAPSGTSFVYHDPIDSSEPVRLTLLSDFGTGLYHSQYIARQILRREPARYLFHLGDVYYAGAQNEFAQRFTPYMRRMMARSRVFTLNANHEMYADGKPYFRFLADKRRARTGVRQEQEGSYFAIRLPGYQIIGLDTACNSYGHFEDGRWRDPYLKHWLYDRLKEGKEAGLTNILLSASQPYELRGARCPLWDDVLGAVHLGWIQLWLWGNTHHCALYRRTDERKFVGSCIGHGGYPYDRIAPLSGPASSLVHWVETRSRFPFADVRPDMGLNGFAELELHRDHMVLRYVDWMNREGPVFTLFRGRSGHLDVQQR